MKYSPAEPQQIIRDHLLGTLDALVYVGMGIGKSAACLDTLNELFRSGSAFGALVVAPMRVANLTWPMEVRGWDEFAWMRIANLRTEVGQRAFLNGRAHIYTINYEGLHNLVSLVERRGGHLPYDVVIFDELTRAKNPSSKRINLYRRKVPRVARQWGLTGTPAPNSTMDLFAQVRLIDGGERLGRNYGDFQREYFFAPENKYDKSAKWKAKSFTTSELERKISDITVTLKSSDWLDIPDTVYEDIDITFTPELREKYVKLEQKLILEIKHKYFDLDGRQFDSTKHLSIANAAALITKLLQFTSGHVYDEEKGVHHIHSLKFDALAKIAGNQKEPLFVASIFKHEQDKLRQLFPKAKFFADAKNERTQELMLNEWNAGKIPMLVAHPASVGHGLNFQHGGATIVWITLTYSREYYDQMIARLARRGQLNITKVYRLMIPGTVDDAVAEALANKAENEARLISALQMLESYRNQNTI